MAGPYKILVPIGCRSDEGLSAPIIRRLKEQDWCEIRTVQLDAQQFIPSYQKVKIICKGERQVGNSNPFKPNLIFITGDRVEMCAAAAAAFHNKIKIAHYYAGVINDPVTTFDDIDRHCITLWSDIQFVEDEEANGVVWDLKYAVNLKPNIHNVGISHLDDLKVDESQVPFTMSSIPESDLIKVPYDLVLWNEPTLTEKNNDIVGLQDIVTEGRRYSIAIGGNPETTVGWLSCPMSKYYDNLPRPQFFGLLKNCQRFITNSSAAIYEAPYFLPPDRIIMVGDRNKNRPRGPFKTGASDRIVEELKKYLVPP